MPDDSQKRPDTLLSNVGKNVGAFVFGIIAAVLATVLGWWLTTNVLASKDAALKILEMAPATTTIESQGFGATIDFDVTVLNDGTGTAERCVVELEAFGGSDNPFVAPNNPLGTTFSSPFGLEAGAKRTVKIPLSLTQSALPTPDPSSFYGSMSIAVDARTDCPNVAQATFSYQYFFTVRRFP
jgi:hypothetical protein